MADSGFDFGKKKKKKVTSKKDDAKEDKTEETTDNKTEEDQNETVSSNKDESAQAVNASEDSKKTSTGTDEFKPAGTDYTYEELARRIFNFINTSRPEEKTVYKMKPPVVYREGNSKTVWVNFPEICKIMTRSPEHVLSFVLAEVGSTGSIDGSGRLVIKGKFQPKHIENILRNYIAEYVKCNTCKSPETHLKKENRLTFMVCEKCGSTRSVTPIKSGFQATTRAQRTKEKEQKGH
eukprot:TRINITY_DN136296_c0_g1_i1.p1 TRINITY_DN136296_c0_g1~~TRINITY_DN136296_c0_g1_i1.p1  ORF type:complete len:247 (-),score=89.99 TRINITY_DN136296_c0_g1_i1:53-760(-)